METHAKRPGLMPMNVIQNQHLSLWDELCEARRQLLVVRFIVECDETAEWKLNKLEEVLNDASQ